MSKIIKYGDEARKILKVGVDAVANATKITIGPKGRNVVFDRGFGGPTITNDGDSIAREIVLKDPLENIGGNICKEVAQKTNDSAGDGTTTSLVLMQSIVEEGMKKISLGINAIGMKNGIEKASKIAVKYLKSVSKPIKNDEETIQVATISSESRETGEIIASTIKELGSDSVITVEEGQTTGIVSEIAQGMEFEKGYVSPYMVTDPNRAEAICKNVSILVTDLKIRGVDEIKNLVETVLASGKQELVVIAEDITGGALNAFILNKLRGGLITLAIKAPGFGARKKDYLEDIAAVVGATFISSELDMSLNNVTLEHLGSADKVISSKDKTTIVGGNGTKEELDNRISLAKDELGKLESKHDKLKVEERIARLSGGVAIIKVGAATETETKYLKLKIEDAVNAVKSALEEGIVAGGGSSLISAGKAVQKAKMDESLTEDERIGFDILSIALEAPLKNIAINCGGGDGSLVVSKVKEMEELGGYDALNDEYKENMIEAGIIDPVKVARSAVENAVSAGSVLLTMECAMAEEPKDKQDIL